MNARRLVLLFPPVLVLIGLAAPEARSQRGHFAAWEQPRLFVNELRTGFRSLR